MIEPQFGKNEVGLPLSTIPGASGPGRIFKNNVHRELDSRNHNLDVEEPVTLKAYKYR